MARRVPVELVWVKIVYGENIDCPVFPPFQMFLDFLKLVLARRPPPTELLRPLVMNDIEMRGVKSEIRSANHNVTTRRAVSFNQP
jgi:hypothetical protein